MITETTEYIYCLSSHQDRVMPVWRRIANRPLRVVAKPDQLPDNAILLFDGDTPEGLTERLQRGKITVLWIEQ